MLGKLNCLRFGDSKISAEDPTEYSLIKNDPATITGYEVKCGRKKSTYLLKNNNTYQLLTKIRKGIDTVNLYKGEDVKLVIDPKRWTVIPTELSSITDKKELVENLYKKDHVSIFSKAYSSISKAGSNVTSYIKSHPRTTLVVLSGIVSFVASFILTKQVSPTAFCDVIGKRTDLFFNGKPILVHKGKMYFCK